MPRGRRASGRFVRWAEFARGHTMTQRFRSRQVGAAGNCALLDSGAGAAMARAMAPAMTRADAYRRPLPHGMCHGTCHPFR